MNKIIDSPARMVMETRAAEWGGRDEEGSIFPVPPCLISFPLLFHYTLLPSLILDPNKRDKGKHKEPKRFDERYMEYIWYHTLQQPCLKKTPKGGRKTASKISTKRAPLEAIIFF